jgi:hypothetical protein
MVKLQWLCAVLTLASSGLAYGQAPTGDADSSPQGKAPAGAPPLGPTSDAPPTATAPADATPRTDAQPAAEGGPETVTAPEPAPLPVAPPPEPVPAGTVASEAAAEPEATPPKQEPDYGLAPRPTPGRRVSAPGGLYIRIGAGLGFPFGPDIADDYEDRNGEELRFAGQALALELMAGAAVLPWIVVGGGFVQDVIAGGTVRFADDSERDIQRSLYFAVIGPFVDVYASPPAGFHVQALLGFAHTSPSYDLGEAATGFGTVLGAGYELRTSRRWNVGILGRIAFASLDRGNVDGEEPKPTMYEPALLITATFLPERD